jgi:tartrate dehydratase alpha subunit/fumarate hydratase class I-like protein
MDITSAQPVEEKILEGFNFRSVGPAGMSGRITAIDVVLKDQDHIYVGSASGGVWESKNGGIEVGTDF